MARRVVHLERAENADGGGQTQSGNHREEDMTQLCAKGLRAFVT